MKAEMIDGLAPYLEWLVLLIDLFAIGLLLWGACLALKDFIFFSLDKKRAKEERIFQNNAIKKMLGGYILLSLEILISAGIIESIIKPTLQDIFQLAALVVIRTVISYFLNKEIGSVETQ
ncbi:DUF1622 domain-containing protein [Enterococcus durans]|uniref:DUF1622 domain-containing protein n=1 Tax=Enterococcus durans TaxID=53345 RepID=UPI0018807749|nr:DUF1622 domain-containing protein [Enterococcus durans]MBE8848530.1 DUF1622 domain-containing protein [Enterococcus durans]WCG27418.1 DUF1622 domain-containing protein [Enterococcus durans]WCG68976.1 DUF1622 domain-containing protein [Enterococcus durans]